MLKNIFCYILILCGIIGTLYIVNIFNNKIDNEFTSLDQMTFHVDESTSGNSLYELADDTVIPVESVKNSHLFPDANYVLFVDDTNHEIYAAKNVHNRMYPASMTKLMTGIVVAEKINAGEISMDDIVTVDKYYDLSYITGISCELKPGSKISVKDLLYGLMIESNNYYALILADYISGSEAAFCDLMNEKAYDIGATNTHYMNPHGLDDPDHYSSAYDTYLIIKYANSIDILREVEQYDIYDYTYINSAGYPIDVSIVATNLFLIDYVELPANYEIEAWKTGTTDGAGNCLAMCLKKDDISYVVIASSNESRQILYDIIVEALCLVGK